jgi:hypothetical protein
MGTPNHSQLFEPLYGLLRAASHTGGHTGETPEGPGASESTLHAEVVQLHAGEFGKMSGEASGKGGIGGVSSASAGYGAQERIMSFTTGHLDGLALSTGNAPKERPPGDALPSPPSSPLSETIG